MAEAGGGAGVATLGARPIVAALVLAAWTWSLVRLRPPLPDLPHFAFGPRRNPARSRAG
ncbi:MAG: hypothetical protein U0168_02350 [Nannocystaceae bacterium]